MTASPISYNGVVKRANFKLRNISTKLHMLINDVNTNIFCIGSFYENPIWPPQHGLQHSISSISNANIVAAILDFVKTSNTIFFCIYIIDQHVFFAISLCLNCTVIQAVISFSCRVNLTCTVSNSPFL